MLGKVIGAGGSMIKQINQTFGVTIRVPPREEQTGLTVAISVVGSARGGDVMGMLEEVTFVCADCRVMFL